MNFPSTVAQMRFDSVLHKIAFLTLIHISHYLCYLHTYFHPVSSIQRNFSNENIFNSHREISSEIKIFFIHLQYQQKNVKHRGITQPSVWSRITQFKQIRLRENLIKLFIWFNITVLEWKWPEGSLFLFLAAHIVT